MKKPPSSQEQLANRVERLLHLQRVTKALNSTQSLPEILRLILRSAIDLSGAETGYLLRFQKEKPAVYLAFDAKGAAIPSEEHRLSFTIVQEVLDTRESKLYEDAAAQPETPRRGSVHKLGLVSILCTPLYARGRLIGALYLENSVRKARFDEDDRDFLEAMADQAGIALTNAHQFERMSTSMENLRRQTRVPEGFESIVGASPARS